MKINVYLMLLILACKPASSSDKSVRNVGQSKKDTTHIRSAVEQYLYSGFGHKVKSRFTSAFEITDTLVMHSLGIVVYRFGTPYAFDDSEYDVIHDLKSGQFFNVVRPGWRSVGMYPSFETTMMLLKDDSELETVNYDYMGLESYLNQCAVHSGKVIAQESLDTLFRRHDLEMNRIKNERDLDAYFGQFNSEINPKKVNLLKKALIKKMKSENVFIYQSYTVLIYFEMNPQNDYWTYLKVYSKDTVYLKDFKDQITNNHQEIKYNLKVFYISDF